MIYRSRLQSLLVLEKMQVRIGVLQGHDNLARSIRAQAIADNRGAIQTALPQKRPNTGLYMIFLVQGRNDHEHTFWNGAPVSHLIHLYTVHMSAA